MSLPTRHYDVPETRNRDSRIRLEHSSQNMPESVWRKKVRRGDVDVPGDVRGYAGGPKEGTGPYKHFERNAEHATGKAPYGSGHDMSHHGEGKPHRGTD